MKLLWTLIKLKFRLILSVIKYAMILLIFVNIQHMYKQTFLFNHVDYNTFQLFGNDGTGTGFVYKYKGHTVTVTNFHVCGFNKTMSYKKDGWFENLEVLAIDIENDLCILESIHHDVGLRYFMPPHHDKPVFTRGYMNSSPKNIVEGYINQAREFEWNLFSSNVGSEIDQCFGGELQTKYNFATKKWDCVAYNSRVLTSLRITPGQSGAPVVDYYGSVVGVITNYDDITNFGYYVPIQRINKLIERRFKDGQ